jgi:hypothetical protein
MPRLWLRHCLRRLGACLTISRQAGPKVVKISVGRLVKRLISLAEMASKAGGGGQFPGAAEPPPARSRFIWTYQPQEERP